jgi:hypothetical protein
MQKGLEKLAPLDQSRESLLVKQSLILFSGRRIDRVFFNDFRFCTLFHFFLGGNLDYVACDRFGWFRFGERNQFNFKNES